MLHCIVYLINNLSFKKNKEKKRKKIKEKKRKNEERKERKEKKKKFVFLMYVALYCFFNK